MCCFLRFPSVAFLFFFTLPAIPSAAAQPDPHRFEIGLHIALLQQRAFSMTDAGFGGRFSFYPITNLGVEIEASHFPRNLGDPLAFSGSRSELLFGPKVGLRGSGFGIFGKVSPGFMHFAKAPRGIACITILVFPPPLECSISTGATSFALDVGGVIESYPTRRTVFRIDLGDTMIRFKGPAYTRMGQFMKGFTVHNFKFNAGFGFRF